MLGGVLRHRRTEMGLTIRDVTKRLGLEYLSNVSSYETGARVPYARIPAIADILRLDPMLLGRAALSIYEPELHKALFGATTPEQEIRNLDPIA